jgi:hypothetical protein
LIRYLLEINGYNDLLDLCEISAAAMKTIKPPSDTIDLEHHRASHLGQLLARIGRPEEGVTWLQVSYDLFEDECEYDPRESAWCAENLANAVATVNDWPKAIKWQERAREHWLEYSRAHCADKTEWSAILKKSMGQTLVWAGELKRAREVLEEGIKQIEAEKPYNWAMAA